MGTQGEPREGAVKWRGGQPRNGEETPCFLSPPSPLTRSHLLSVCCMLAGMKAERE